MTQPVVTNVTASNANGTYRAGTFITIEVVFDQVIFVTSSPQLTLDLKPANKVIDYMKGSGSTIITFEYAVASGDATLNLDYAAIGSLALNGGTIKNAGTEDAVLDLPSPGAAGSLSANKDINVGMIWVVGFKDAGVPKTGLSPVITTPLVTRTGSAFAGCTAIVEHGGGRYKFAADPTEPVDMVIDGTATLADVDRYLWLAIGPQDSYLDAPVSSVLDRIGLGGMNLIMLGDGRLDHLDADMSSRAVAGDAMALTSAERTSVAIALLDLVDSIEANVTLRKALRGFVATLMGKSSGGPLAQKFRNVNDTKDVIDVTCDVNGNRTGISLDLT